MFQSDVKKDFIPRASSPFENFAKGQSIHELPSFGLECGSVLHNVPVAYKTWGTLNDTKSNVLVICHAFSGSACVDEWWAPLLGPGKAFDTDRFFIFCGNVLGSPYGTCSPLTLNPSTGEPYGPSFPLTTIRDDVRLHRAVMDHLGVQTVQLVVGGSMGGMQALEWAFYGSDYVRAIAPIATSGRHSAWCISWGEAQRQAIYSDPLYQNGFYSLANPPITGLAAARMSALLTYRSRNSFESRFGRKTSTLNPPNTTCKRERAVQNHNEGNKIRFHSPKSPSSYNFSPSASHPPVFSAQSYLRYQGDKFTARFDANCYIAITRKLDTHDLSRDRGDYFDVLHSIEQPTLIIGIESDGLFTIDEQRELEEWIPNGELAIIQSGEGHDGFLLEFEQINSVLTQFITKVLSPELPILPKYVDAVKLERGSGDMLEW